MSAIDATTLIGRPVGGEALSASTSAAWITPRRIKRIAWSIIGISFVMLVVSFSTARQGRTVFGSNLGGDWLAFHNAAVILNTAGSAHLYDTQLQQDLYHAALPDEPANVSLPYANAPFLAMLIKPLGNISYAGSFGIWTICSVLMFFAAMLLAWRAADLPRGSFTLALLLCFSFEPFVFECIHGGQVSAIGLLAITGAAFLHITGWPVVAGISLAICMYKPTLLPIVLLMLVATRQWRVLAGFGYGAVVLMAISMSRMGGACWLAYAKTLMTYASKSSSPANEAIFRTWKFIDLNSFLKLLGASPRWIAIILLSLVALLYRWLAKHAQIDSANNRRLAWGIALSGTLILNVYVGIYDSILILPALIFTAGAIRGKSRSPTFEYICVATYILPWCSQAIAQRIGFQPFTLAIVAVVLFQAAMLGRKRLDEQFADAQSDNPKVSSLAAPMKAL